MKLSRSCWRGFVVILFAAIMGMSGCGGGGSASPPDDGGDTTTPDDGGDTTTPDDGGDVAVPLTVSASAEAMTIAPTTVVMSAIGIDMVQAEASASASKATLWPNVCEKDMDRTVSCDSIPGGVSGTATVQGYCGMTTQQYDHMGLIADVDVVLDECAYQNAVMSGKMHLRMIMAAYEQNWNNAVVEARVESDTNNPVISQAAGGGSAPIVLEWIEYSGQIDDGSVDLPVERGITSINGSLIPGFRNPAGDVEWGDVDTDPTLLQQMLDQVLEPVDYCFDDGNEDLTCDPAEVNEDGVHEYCRNNFIQASSYGWCDAGCCELYREEEFLGDRKRECQQGFYFSEVYLATYYYMNDQGVLMNHAFEVPLLCINSFWSLPCADDSDCVKGVCNINTPDLGNALWNDFKGYYDGYGFCVLWYYDLVLNDESMCEGGNCCTDGLDNDGDCLIDCADRDCVGNPACRVGPFGEICDDGIDNNFDFNVDCDAWTCHDDPACEGGGDVAACVDGADNDGNGKADCDDKSCLSNFRDDPTYQAFCDLGEVCWEAGDEDGDLDADCADSECICMSTCKPYPAEICGDGIDNDCDFRTDCEDFDCMGPACAEICFDREDNDGDGLTDGKDPDCAGHPACTHDETDCTDPPCCANGLDDDYDFLIDCVPGIEDPDCNCS